MSVVYASLGNSNTIEDNSNVNMRPIGYIIQYITAYQIFINILAIKCITPSVQTLYWKTFPLQNVAIHREIHILCSSLTMHYVTKLHQHSTINHIRSASKLFIFKRLLFKHLVSWIVSLTYSSNNGSLLPLKCTAHQTEYICCCFFFCTLSFLFLSLHEKHCYNDDNRYIIYNNIVIYM